MTADLVSFSAIFASLATSILTSGALSLVFAASSLPLALIACGRFGAVPRCVWRLALGLMAGAGIGRLLWVLLQPGPVEEPALALRASAGFSLMGVPIGVLLAFGPCIVRGEERSVRAALRASLLGFAVARLGCGARGCCPARELVLPYVGEVSIALVIEVAGFACLAGWIGRARSTEALHLYLIGFGAIRALSGSVRSWPAATGPAPDPASVMTLGAVTFIAAGLVRFTWWMGDPVRRRRSEIPARTRPGVSRRLRLKHLLETDPGITELPQGGALYHPWGRRRATYVLASRSDVEHVRRVERVATWVAVASMLALSALGWSWAWLGIVVAGGVVQASHAWVARSLDRAPEAALGDLPSRTDIRPGRLALAGRTAASFVLAGLAVLFLRGSNQEPIAWGLAAVVAHSATRAVQQEVRGRRRGAEPSSVGAPGSLDRPRF